MKILSIVPSKRFRSFNSYFKKTAVCVSFYYYIIVFLPSGKGLEFNHYS